RSSVLPTSSVGLSSPARIISAWRAIPKKAMSSPPAIRPRSYLAQTEPDSGRLDQAPAGRLSGAGSVGDEEVAGRGGAGRQGRGDVAARIGEGLEGEAVGYGEEGGGDGLGGEGGAGGGRL